MPRAERHLALIMTELTAVDMHTQGSRVLGLDDADLFDFPIAYMWEPGFWNLTDREAIFVFEGAGPSGTLTLPGEDPRIWRAAEAWAECLAEKPRVARIAFSWQRVQGPEGVSFEPTPGPGASEGGDVYPPERWRLVKSVVQEALAGARRIAIFRHIEERHVE
mgnify:CR=1 FL=1